MALLGIYGSIRRQWWVLIRCMARSQDPLRKVCFQLLLGRQLHLKHDICWRLFRRTCVANDLHPRVVVLGILSLHLHWTSTMTHLLCSATSQTCNFVLGRRSYTRSVDEQITTENDATAASRKSEKGKKKRTRKATKSDKDKANLPSNYIKEVADISLNFPFEGTLHKQEASGAFKTSKHLQNLVENVFTVHIGTASSGSDTRMYNIHKNGEVFHLPSVTTVLGQTLPRQRSFMLSRWKKGVVREVGENGYLQVRDQFRNLGSRFHEELEARLHRPHLFSIKPQTVPPPPPPPPPPLPSSTHTHHNHLSPLPPPLSFPPNHSNNMFNSNTQPSVGIELVTEEGVHREGGVAIGVKGEGGVASGLEREGGVAIGVKGEGGVASGLEREGGVAIGVKGEGGVASGLEREGGVAIGVEGEGGVAIGVEGEGGVAIGVEGEEGVASGWGGVASETEGKEGAVSVIVGGEEEDVDSEEDSVQRLPGQSSEGRSTGYLESVQHVLDDISEVYALESVVAHLELGYSGTCDCIATYRGAVCLIDWKTSLKPRPLTSDLYDYPLQAVAYAGAINQDPHYPLKVENVLIVTAYPSGDPSHAHFLSRPLCEDYWTQWLARLLQYQTLFSSDLEDVCS